MVKLESFWLQDQQWIIWENNERKIKDNAPVAVKESYQRYKQQLHEIDKRTIRTFVIPKNEDGLRFYEKYDPDWSRGSYEDNLLIVFDIPFEEFCILRNDKELNDFLEEWNFPISGDDITALLTMVSRTTVKKTLEVIEKAKVYNTIIDFIEEHII